MLSPRPMTERPHVHGQERVDWKSARSDKHEQRRIPGPQMTLRSPITPLRCILSGRYLSGGTWDLHGGHWNGTS